MDVTKMKPLTRWLFAALLIMGPIIVGFLLGLCIDALLAQMAYFAYWGIALGVVAALWLLVWQAKKMVYADAPDADLRKRMQAAADAARLGVEPEGKPETEVKSGKKAAVKSAKSAKVDEAKSKKSADKPAKHGMLSPEEAKIIAETKKQLAEVKSGKPATKMVKSDDSTAAKSTTKPTARRSAAKAKSARRTVK